MGVLAGEISGAISEPIAKSTGLDIFRLEASESGQISKLAVGKELTDRLTVEFQSDFAPETAQRMFQANYYLTDNILLKGRRVWVTGQSNTAPPYNLNMSFRLRMY
jgi:autotransporter translocation and assembly factor TamB